MQENVFSPFKNHSILMIKGNRVFFRLLKKHNWFIEFKFVHFYDCFRQNRRSVQWKKGERLKNQMQSKNLFLKQRFHKWTRIFSFLLTKKKKIQKEEKWSCEKRLLCFESRRRWLCNEFTKWEFIIMKGKKLFTF